MHVEVPTHIIATGVKSIASARATPFSIPYYEGRAAGHKGALVFGTYDEKTQTFDGVALLAPNLSAWLYIEPLRRYDPLASASLMLVHIAADRIRQNASLPSRTDLLNPLSFISRSHDRPPERATTSGQIPRVGAARYGVCPVELIADSDVIERQCSGNGEFCAAMMVTFLRGADAFYRSVDLDGDGRADGIGFGVHRLVLLDAEEDVTQDLPLEADADHVDALVDAYVDATMKRPAHPHGCLRIWVTNRNFAGILGFALLGGNCYEANRTASTCDACKPLIRDGNARAIIGVCGSEFRANLLVLSLFPGK